MRHDFDPYARNYQSLSVRDLLEAREAYHIHLAHLENVFATAVGLYRIREHDKDYDKHTTPETARQQRGTLDERRFDNTAVLPWSWPCVLVFVKEWIQPEDLQKHRDQIVPPFLYLPDGRVIPACVLKADLFGGPAEETVGVDPDAPVLASGQPIVTRVQGREHVGTVAGIVFDGEKYYALTNQHVSGAPGNEVFAYFGGRLMRIGVAAGAALERLPFEKVYPGLPGKYTLSNLDYGLVELDSLDRWSSNMHGLHDKETGRTTAKLGSLVEFRSDTATLDWIGCRVVGYGAASGVMEGEVKALFYRYRTVGGVDYVSDFLIGDREPVVAKPERRKLPRPLRTAPGDSGALWCVDPSQMKHYNGEERPPRPFAVQWGGQKLITSSGEQYTRYALGSSLAVALRELDVDLVTDWNTEHTQYWGAVGHYKIAGEAIGLLKNDLRDFMSRHLELITYRSIVEEPAKRDPAKDFIPLADVPDLVWKKTKKDYAFGRRGPENANHYADIDLLDAGGKHELISCGTDAQAWLDFYNKAPVPPAGYKEMVAQAAKDGKPKPKKTGIEYQHQGLLPFRIWQIFEAMVEYSRNNQAAEFLCAAGILAHYVGDACQPLHGSRHADGLEGAATGVHSTYEDLMVDAYAQDIADGLAKYQAKLLVHVRDGEDAAKKTLAMMDDARGKLKPEDICKAFDDYKKQNGIHSKNKLKKAVPALKKFVPATVKVMELGIQLLASMWQSAFELGQPSSEAFQKVISDHALQALYFQPDFLPSYYLSHWIDEVGGGRKATAATAAD